MKATKIITTLGLATAFLSSCGTTPKEPNALELAQKYQIERDYSLAAAMWTKVISKPGGETYSNLCNRGLCFKAAGKSDKAIADYKKAVKLAGNVAETQSALLFLARLELNSNLYNDAITSAESLLEFNSSHYEAFYIKGKSHFYLKDYKTAIISLSKTISKFEDGNDIMLDSMKSLALAKLRLKDDAKARQYFEKYFTAKQNSGRHINNDDWYWRGVMAYVNLDDELKTQYWNNLPESYKKSKNIK